MKTSYFAKSAKDPHAISIALKPPWWFKGRKYPALAPPLDLLQAYKAGTIGQARYAEIYQAQILDWLDPHQVFLDLGEDAILLCWEAVGKFCHRRLAAAWLESALGIGIPEVEV